MANIQVTSSVDLNNARSESVVLINPNNPQQMVAASKKFKNITNYDFTLATANSNDGGQTWSESTELALLPTWFGMSDPTLAWDDSGNVFLVALPLKEPPPHPQSLTIGIAIYKSTDGGRTWGQPQLIHTSDHDDKQWAAGDANGASPHHGNVYAAWDEGGPPGNMRFARSLNHGDDWKSTDDNLIKDVSLVGDSFAPELNVAPNGDLYIVYLNGEGGSNIKFLKSIDGGDTFTGPFVAASGISSIRGSFPEVDGFPHFPNAKFRVLTLATGCVGPGSDLVIFAWADGREGPAGAHRSRIYFRRSINGGTDWEGPASGQPLLTGAIPDDFHHFHPQLIADPNGVIGCAFYELGPKPTPTTPLIDVIFAQSLDGGLTFVPFRVTDQAWNPATDAPLSHGDPNVTFIGEYFGLDASEQGFYAVWTDTRTGIQELWGDIVPVKRCAFIVERSTLGQDEIDARRGRPGGPVVPDAFRIVVDGFTAAQLGVVGPASTKAVASPAAGIAITCTGNTSATGDYGPEIQRFTFHYNIDFGPDDTAFGFAGETEFLTLNANILGLTASAQIELIKQPNPFILHGDPGWLSIDLRVFSVFEGQAKFGATMGHDPSQAPAFIQQVIANLTAGQGSAGGQTFDGDLPVEEAENLFVFPRIGPFGLGPQVFNFGVAKVHYIGLIGATNVRVFFRLFQAASTDTSFSTSTTYRRATNPTGQPIPLAGIIGDEYVTIPFFATPRVDSTVVGMDQQRDSPNIQPIAAGSGGAEVFTFFGCWLDINQPRKDGHDNNVLPVRTPGSNIDGPFTDPSHPPLTIQQAILRNPHQCFVAEIAFDPVPIPAGKTPYDWDKLAQRNLAWSDIPNPGGDGSRTALSTFEVRPTPLGLSAGQSPDELMIDWGNVPAGTRASIYLPAVNVDDVIKNASAMYTTHALTRVDSHTLSCPARGLTYIPLPAGTEVNYAGLLSVDLPLGVNKGQVFNVVVRQVTNAFGEPPVIIEFAPSTADAKLEWRQVLGAFQLTIPVRTSPVILERHERLLSVFKWIGQAIPVDSRWYPVFTRYLDQLGGKVTGLGGDADDILPSPDGTGRAVKCHWFLKWLVPLLLAVLLVIVALLPLIFSAPIAAAGVVLIIAAICYWQFRCKPSMCEVLWALMLATNIAALILGLIVLLGFRTLPLLLMLAVLAIVNAVFIVLATFRRCCFGCDCHEGQGHS